MKSDASNVTAAAAGSIQDPQIDLPLNENKRGEQETADDYVVRGGEHQNPECRTLTGEELVGGGAEKRNWKGMAIAILVILIVCGFVVLAVVLSAEEERKINFVNRADMASRAWLKALARNAKWTGDDDLVWQDRWMNVKIRQGGSMNESSILISNATLKRFGADRYEVSSDKRYALFIYNIQPKFSSSFDASYSVYTRKTKQISRLLHNKTNSTLQFVGFGPNGNDLVYVFDGDLYYKRDVEQDTTHRVTNDNTTPHKRIVNGIPDWLYEEEVLHSRAANWWSPDGRFLAFARFDNSKVAESFVTKYMKKSDHNSMRQYSKKDSFFCPKTGSKQPTVTIRVYDRETNKVITLSAPQNSRLTLLQSVSWSGTSDTVLVTWSDRTQREAAVQACDLSTGVCHDRVSTISSANRNGWIWDLARQSPISAAAATSSGDASLSKVFFWLVPQNQGGQGNFKHIAMVNFTEDTPKTWFLTNGLFDVVEILHYDVKTRSLYFLSKEKSHREQHLYQLYINSSNPTSIPESTCLTCDNAVKGCSFYQAKFPTKSNNVLIDCLGPEVPSSYIGSLNGNSWDGDLVKISDDLEGEAEFRLNTSNFEFEYKWLEETRNGREINAQVVMPKEIEPGKFGVLFEIADVGTHNVNDEYKLGILEYLTSRYNIFSVRIDGAGSGLGGESVLHALNDDPSKEIVKDVNVILTAMEEELKLSIGPIAFIGKGFGGHVAISSLLDPQNDRLPCSVAISPIVDWEAHTSVPSEKLFGLFSENMKKYQNSNILKSSKLQADIGKKLLVFHGLLDRKVHHQHSVALTATASHDLVEAVFYGTQGHVMTDARQQNDLVGKTHDFVLQCFKESPLSI